MIKSDPTFPPGLVAFLWSVFLTEFGFNLIFSRDYLLLKIAEMSFDLKGKGKSVPLQARGGRLSALRTGCLYPQKNSWYSFLLEAESTPGP